MKKARLNIIVNLISLLSLIIVSISGFVLLIIFSRGGATFFLNLSRFQWLRMHDVSSILFIILMLVHIILHWSWFKNLPKLWKNSK